MTARTVAAIKTVSDEIDASAALALWEDAASLTHDAPGVWLHGDLKADNLIAADGNLAGVIDWGLSAVGDPATDYAAAMVMGRALGQRQVQRCSGTERQRLASREGLGALRGRDRVELLSRRQE